MSTQRMLFEIINFCMALLFVIPLGVLVEQLCGYPLYRCCLIPCVSIVGFLLGRFSMTKPMNLSIGLSAVSLVVSVGLSLILCPGMHLVTLFITLISGFFSVFFFFSARKAGYTVYAPMAIGGILIHLFVLICCTGFEWDTQIGSFTSVIAIIFFLLTLFAFSAKGLRKSLHKGSGERGVTYPAGMQMGNFLLVTGFILIAAFISNIYPIFNVFSHLFGYVLKAIIAFFGFFTGLFDRRSVSADIDEGVSESVAEDSILNAEPKGEASWITTGVEIFAFILVMLFLCYGLFKLMQKLRASGRRLPGFLQNLKDKFAPVVDEDFTDETETLMDAKKMLADTGARFKKALKKLRERPQKLDDFPDNRMKVRFAFQQLLKKVVIRDPSASAKTPNEILAKEYPGEEEFIAFMDYYNQAKYSDQDIPEDAVDCARGILKQKL
jgi:hypothetical protein